MSVIVRRLANPTMEVFVKGAPEVMKDICTPESSKQRVWSFIRVYVINMHIQKCPRIIKRGYTSIHIVAIVLLHVHPDSC